MTAAVLLAWVAIALLAFVVSHLVRQVSLLAGRGGQKPQVTPTAIALPEEVLRQVGDPTRRFALVLVVGESCMTCHHLLPRYLELARGDFDRDASFSVASVTDGKGLQELVDGLPVLPHAKRWTDSIGISVTPYLVVVDMGRKEASGRAVGSRKALEEAVTSALAVEEIAG